MALAEGGGLYGSTCDAIHLCHSHLLSTLARFRQGTSVHQRMNSNSKCNADSDEETLQVVFDRVRQWFHLQRRGVCHAVSAPDLRRAVDDCSDADLSPRGSAGQMRIPTDCDGTTSRNGWISRRSPRASLRRSWRNYILDPVKALPIGPRRKSSLGPQMLHFGFEFKLKAHRRSACAMAAETFMNTVG